MIARGAIHNPKIFEEYKNSFDQFDLDEDRELAQREEFDEDELDNEVFEIKDENASKLDKQQPASELNKEEEKDREEESNVANQNNYKKKDANKNIINKNKNEDHEVKTSHNLFRIFNSKYQGRIFDLNPIIKDYLTFVSLCFLFIYQISIFLFSHV